MGRGSAEVEGIALHSPRFFLPLTLYNAEFWTWLGYPLLSGFGQVAGLVWVSVCLLIKGAGGSGCSKSVVLRS